MHDVEASQVPLDVHDLSLATDVVATSDESKVPRLIVIPLRDRVLFEVELYSVSLLDFRVGEADGARVMTDDVRHLVGSDGLALDLKQFIACLTFLDLDQGDSSLDVVEKAVVLVDYLIFYVEFNVFVNYWVFVLVKCR